jgi:hypothetical protein
MRWNRVAACAAVFATLISPAAALRAAQSQAERQEMRDTFLRRVDDYVRLHRELERLLPPEVVTSDLDALFAPRIALGREMRNARARARQGDVFAPSVAVYFRVMIAETLWRERMTGLLAIIEEENTIHVRATVNGDYPAGRPIPPVRACLLAALPPLPPEVRYSFIGADLILWDMHAGLIVDFVPNAVPVLTGGAHLP